MPKTESVVATGEKHELNSGDQHRVLQPPLVQILKSLEHISA